MVSPSLSLVYLYLSISFLLLVCIAQPADWFPPKPTWLRVIKWLPPLTPRVEGDKEFSPEAFQA